MPNFPAKANLIKQSGVVPTAGQYQQALGDLLDWLRTQVWTPGTTYAQGHVVRPVANSGLLVFEAVVGGTSHATTEPTWPSSAGGTVTDGTVTWIARTASGGAGGGGAAIGLGNYIAEPFSVVPGTGLEVLVNPNRCVIDETAVESASQTAVALTAKAAQLVFKKKDGTYDKLLPKMAAADLVDANTVGLWFPDGSASVPNAAVGVNGSPAVANALVKTGTITAVDGWAGGDAAKGSANGKYESAGNIGITGAATRTLIVKIKHHSEAVDYRVICGWGSSASTMTLFSTASDNQLYVLLGGLTATGFYMEDNKDYIIAGAYDGTAFRVYINGALVFFTNYAINTDATHLWVFYQAGFGQYYKGIIDLIQIQNNAMTPAQIATLAQKLLIPCKYGNTDIRDALTNKAESQVVSFVIANSTAPTTIIAPDDPKSGKADWAYGMRIGPSGVLNKTKRLGRKSFSGTSAPEWDDPFGSRNMTLNAEWSLDSAGTISSPIPNDAANSYPSVLVNGKIRETITTGVMVAGSQKTSGYVDIIAEVID